MAAEVPRGLGRTAFLLNQYATCLSVYTDRGAAPEDAAKDMYMNGGALV